MAASAASPALGAGSGCTPDEAERLAVLDSYAILDTLAEAEFDDIVRLVADALGAPIAAINLVAGDRQWFKAEHGIGLRETPLDLSICVHAIAQDSFMVVPDARLDPRLADHPLVAEENGLRFYAGALLRSPEGPVLGTLCVLDRAPRPGGVTARERRLLEVMARQVMVQFELRRTIALQKAQAGQLRAEVARRMEAARALRGIEERYRLVSRATNDAVWDWDIVTDQILWNEAIETAYGHRMADVEPTGAWWFAQIHDEDRRRIERSIHALMEGGGTRWSDEYRFRRADGSYAPVLDRGFIIRDDQGRARRMIGAMFDLTERRRQEAELEISNQRLQVAVDAIAAFLWTNNAEGRMQGVQPGWAALTGQDYDEYQGYGWADALHPEDAPGCIAAWQTAVAARAMYVHEHRVRTASGEWRRFTARGLPLFDEHGELTEWVGIHADVTERREQERAIQDNEARLQFLDDLSRNISVASDADTVMDITTRMVARRLEVAHCAYAHMDPDGGGFAIRGDCAARGLPSLVGHYRLGEASSPAGEQLRAGRPLIVNDPDVDLVPDDAAMMRGWGIAATICMPLIRGGRLIALMGIHDTQAREWTTEEFRLVQAVAERSWAHVERVRAASALAELNASLEQRVEERTRQLIEAESALRQAQKMEAVGQLTGGIAHDFNNLLTIVMGSTDIARRMLGRGETERATRALDNAQKGVERAAALTQRLLAFSRRQPLDPRPLNADMLVGGMSDLLGRALGETVELEVLTTPGLWRIEADLHQLENAILNLAVNARDAMPDGGRLVIRTANTELDERYAATHAEVAPGQYTAIAVADTGTGMDPATLQRVFEPFFTTKEVGKGTGLGLSQVYGFVRQSGGHVGIQSEPGQGTTVTIYLPRLVVEGAEDGDDCHAAPPGPIRRDETILVVEDDDDVRAYTVEVLRELGYRVLEAHDGVSALRLLERQDAPVGLMFTDVVMPGMSGCELVEQARQAQPGLRVLYTSGYTRNAIANGGRLEPGVELIAKPFTFDALARKIRNLLDNGGTE